MKCNRCGKCCHYIGFDNELHKCRMLIAPIDHSRTICRIYGFHHGHQISKGVRCVPIEKWLYRPGGCPFNEGKPLPPWER